MKRLKMEKNKEKGILISFCGLDGSGKTTLINGIIDELAGEREVVLIKQPTEAVRTNKMFRAFSDGADCSEYDYRAVSLLAASDRLQQGEAVIRRELASGRLVISDRYFYSCLANLIARGYGGDKWIYEAARHVIKPDLAFFCELPAEMAVERVHARPFERERYTDIEFEKRLAELYGEICRKNGGISVPTDCDKSESLGFVMKKIREVLKNESSK